MEMSWTRSSAITLEARLKTPVSRITLRSVMVKGYPITDPLILRDIGILAAFAVLMAIAAIASIRREVA